MVALTGLGCGNGEGATATPTDASPTQKDGAVAATADADAAGGSGDGGSGGDVAAVDVGPPSIGGPVTVTDDFWIVYGRRSRTTGAGVTENDVVLTAWKNPKAGPAQNPGAFGLGASPLDATKPAIELTKYSFKKAGDLTCNHGCLLTPDLSYIAIAAGPPDIKGLFTYQLGKIKGDLSVFVEKFGQLKDVKHIAFAQGFLFYSTPANCLSTGKCQYDIHRVPLSEDPDSKDEVLTKMAPDADPDAAVDTVYDGYFYVSEDATTLVFLTPTIRSTKVYAWRGGNVTKLDYICESPLGDSCVGTGSQYHDNDGVAISQDGKTIAMFSIVSKWMRVRKYVLGSEEPPLFSNLVQTEGIPYLKKACAVLQPHQHAEVRGQPYFSADGKWLFFRGVTDLAKCEPPIGKSGEKLWTDLMAIPIAKIGGVIGKNEWVNLTNNPRNSSAKNRLIKDFSMSPKRQVFLMSATATVDQNGAPIPDTSNRHKSDTELYTMIVGAPDMVPITNELSFDADAPRAVLPVKP
ncbi:MAG: hypothetical protein EXR79_11550 [Myxococcales bacterium]|nr:hypothetical protein [Myxococcales bacterium]